MKLTNLLTLFFVLLLCGCGTKLPIVPVSGTVTLDGKPLEGFQVFFQPVHEKTSETMLTSSGLTDARGKFLLKTVEENPRNGASVGEYRVLIGWVDPNSMALGDSESQRQPPAKIPEKIQTDGIIFTVPPNGIQTANFHLKSDD
ncbi:MAG: hypothetical protein LBK82_15135 [Planctomycetaceae bacterium]|jgi:hypothetical protein|nr:hypothetical protein [Planctomycetaceae bacterium]